MNNPREQRELRNANGRILCNIRHYQGAQRITMEEVENWYEQYQGDKTRIAIKVMTNDGFKTIKPYDYNEPTLHYFELNEYYASLPQAVRANFQSFLFVQVFVR